MNFTEDNQLISFESVVKDLVTAEELIGELSLERYEPRVVERKRNSNRSE
ncbi:hypothetical protein [Sporosarcina sp. YIM B06819]|nr:hypothetical protein [Sporosarcina sp. YIM B06819]